MKRVLTGIMALILTLTAVMVSANEQSIKVFVDNVEVEFDVEPQIINGRTMVPLRAIFEALKATVEWDEATRTITSTRGIINIKITVGEDVLYKNAKPVKLDAPAQVVNSRTLVPIRAIAEAFECDVQWDGEKRTVNITSSEIITAQGRAWEKAKKYIEETHDGEYEMYTEQGICTIMYNEFTDSVMMRYSRDNSDTYICNAVVNFYKDADTIRVCVVYCPTFSSPFCDAELFIEKADVVRGIEIKFEDETVPEGNLELMSIVMTEALPDMLDSMNKYFAAVDVSVHELGLINYK